MRKCNVDTIVLVTYDKTKRQLWRDTVPITVPVCKDVTVPIEDFETTVKTLDLQSVLRTCKHFIQNSKLLQLS